MAIRSLESQPIWRFLSRMLLLTLLITRTSGLVQQLCSSQNTGSDSTPVSNHFQSNGACSTTCRGYAYGIVQGQSCWCSNYAPSDTGSTSSCNVPCPGYPFENCGDQSSGLYGYVALGPSPSGTIGSSNAASTDSGSFPSSAVSSDIPVLDSSPSPIVTVQATVTATPSVQISYISVTPSPQPETSSIVVIISSQAPTTTYQPTSTYIPPPPTTLSPSTTSTTTSSTPSSTPTWSPTPVVSVETVTGQVKTLTMTPTAPPPAVQTIVAAEPEENSGGFFTNTGKVAGTFVAVAVVILLLAGLIIWFLLRRRQQHDEILPVPSVASGGTPQRRPSRLSQMGLIGSAGSGSQRDRGAPRIQTSGLGTGNGSEKSPADTMERRNSYPRVVDQRLEPTALWNPLHDNGSHVSVRSFRDDQDYSRRMLRIANPDDA